MSLKLGTTLIAGSLPAPTGAMTYKGSVLQADLPTTGQVIGDYYKLTDTSAPYAGQCAIWNGSAWDYSSGSIAVDSSLSTTSTNPVENKAITAALNNLDYISKTDKIKSVWSGTLAEYNALATKDATKIYNITDDTTESGGLYLPLAGGTMTGAITLSADIRNNSINSAVDNKWIGIFGGTDNKSAGIWLNGKDAGGASAGGFTIQAANDTVTVQLSGKVDKSLTWDSRDVITSTSNNGIKKIWKGTLAEYNAITTKDENVEYHIIDDNKLVVDCLPLGGGIMSGVIQRNGYLAEGEETTSAVHLSGGKGGYMSGASVELYGKDNTAGAGKFVICASNGSIAPALQGLPNGQLTWNNMRIPTIVSTYINATSDVNGNLNISTVRPAGTSIPIGFLGNSSIMGTETARFCFMTGGYYMSFSNSGSTWEAWANQPIAGTIYWMVL